MHKDFAIYLCAEEAAERMSETSVASEDMQCGRLP
jgi:hypothetical protein